MTTPKVTLASELERMTPAERHEHFQASVVTDLSQVPPDYLARIRADFFAHLDFQLPPDRGPHGEPSTADFQTYELLEIVERFAVGWVDLPELIPGRPQYG